MVDLKYDLNSSHDTKLLELAASITEISAIKVRLAELRLTSSHLHGNCCLYV